jgi:hypothetical protein
MCVGTGTGWHEAQEAGPGLQASVPDPYSGHFHNYLPAPSDISFKNPVAGDCAHYPFLSKLLLKAFDQERSAHGGHSGADSA